MTKDDIYSIIVLCLAAGLLIGWAMGNSSALNQNQREDGIQTIANVIDMQLPDNMPKATYKVEFTDCNKDIILKTKAKPIITTISVKVKTKDNTVVIKPLVMLKDSITNQIFIGNYVKSIQKL